MVSTTAAAPASLSPKKPFYRVLYVQVLFAIVLGAVVGWLFPAFATNDWIKALGDGFVKLIKISSNVFFFLGRPLGFPDFPLGH